MTANSKRGFTRINFGKQNSRGFTLIELLVVVTIIVILGTIGLLIFTSVFKQGKDGKRQSDLRSIQSALEQYFFDQGFYPQTTLNNGLDTALNTFPLPALTSSTGNPSPPPPAKTYMNALPKDPTGTDRYRYVALPNIPCDNSSASNKCSGYCLYANFESNSPGLGIPDCTANVPAAQYDFAVSPP